MKVHIIANPAAGGGRGERLAGALHRELEACAVTALLTFTQRSGEAHGVAQRTDAECLVCVGGDGTANEILNGMDLERQCLTLLPAGTANVVARELKLKPDPAALARLIAGRSLRKIDMGLLNGRRFLLGAGAGFDAIVARRVAEQRSGLRGLRRWVRPTLGALWSFNHAPIRVRVDGETLIESSPYAIVGNCRYTAGFVPTTPRASLTDGRLDLCALRTVSAPTLAWLALRVWTPGFPESRALVYRQGSVIELEAASDLAVPVHVDGETAGFLPARCTVAPLALRVVAPV